MLLLLSRITGTRRAARQGKMVKITHKAAHQGRTRIRVRSS
jgi:hypothetical protein